jgi:crotonobetainyl-CoA:carnitine CoA-transferase CaiB-like acyl-CoA transferase
MRGALDGVRILDLSWGIAGPLGVLLLAEQGADTIKVEPPGGDPFRRYSGYHVWNRSRRSVEVDLRNDVGREAFLRLAETADVVVEAFRPGTLDRLGVGWATLLRANQRIVLCSVPAIRGHRFAKRAGWGRARASVVRSTVPTSPGGGWARSSSHAMPSMGAAFLVPAGILSALLRRADRHGQRVRTSLLQGAFLYDQVWQEIEHATAFVHEIMGKTYPMGIHQPTIYETRDGWIHCSMLSGGHPKRSLDEVIGLEPGPGASNALTAEEREALTQRRRAVFRNLPTATLWPTCVRPAAGGTDHHHARRARSAASATRGERHGRHGR